MTLLSPCSVPVQYGGVVVDDALVAQLPNLRHVQLLSAGFSEVTPQIAELNQRGVTVSNNGGSNAISVAEHASEHTRNPAAVVFSFLSHCLCVFVLTTQ